MANVPISNFTVPANTVGIGATGYSLTGSASASFMDVSGTWNTSGTPTLIKANVTDTASNANSLLMDLQVGGVSKTKLLKNGQLISVYPSWMSTSGATTGYSQTNGDGVFQFYASSGAAAVSLGFGNNDLVLSRRAAANLRLGAADAATPVAQTLSVQSVVAGTTNTAGANLTITGSQGTGTGAGGSIVFQVAPAGSSGTAQNALATALTIGSNTDATFARNVRVGNDGGLIALQIDGATQGFSTASGNVLVRTTSGKGFGIATDNSTSADTLLFRDAANALALRNGTNAQTQRWYGTFTDASNYRRVALAMTTAGVATLKPEGAGTGASDNVIHISGLPTSNPGPGILWNNAGTPAIGT